MTRIIDLPPEQQAIWDKCSHPTGTFVEFKKEEIEQTISQRFEQMAREYPDRLSFKTRRHALTYDELNGSANRLARSILENTYDVHGQRSVIVQQNRHRLVPFVSLRDKDAVRLSFPIPNSHVPVQNCTGTWRSQVLAYG